MIPSSDFTAIWRFGPSDILWIPDFQDTQLSQWPWQTWWISLETFGSIGTMRGCWSWWWWWGCSQMLLQVQLAHHGVVHDEHRMPSADADPSKRAADLCAMDFLLADFSLLYLTWTSSDVNSAEKNARKAWRCLEVLGCARGTTEQAAVASGERLRRWSTFSVDGDDSMTVAPTHRYSWKWS